MTKSRKREDQKRRCAQKEISKRLPNHEVVKVKENLNKAIRNGKQQKQELDCETEMIQTKVAELAEHSIRLDTEFVLS